MIHGKEEATGKKGKKNKKNNNLVAGGYVS